MTTPHTYSSRSRPFEGFTLLEVVVVLGLLVVLMGGAVAIGRGGGRAIALRTAQDTVMSLLTVARSEAALRGRNVALLVQTDSTARAFLLRRLVVAVEEGSPDVWFPLHAWQTLPSGVAFLPSVVPAGDAVEAGATWGALRSSALAGASVMCDGLACAPLVFTSRGTVFRGAGDLVLAPANPLSETSMDPWQYVQPEAVRGVSVSVYGLVTIVDDVTGF